MNADRVFVRGRLFSPGQVTSHPGALAVADGRILAVGTDEQVGELVGPRTEVVDLAGGLLLPGFQDAHVHPVMAGVGMLRCDVHGCADADAALAAIAAYAASNPDLPWIVGSGWSMDHYPSGTPTRQLLDSVVPDRPAYLTNRDGHGAWVNTAAIERAGLGPHTPDPVDGRVEREADGFPAGTLHEGAAALVAGLLPGVTAQEQRQGLLAAQDHLFSLGVTSWQDAAVGEVFGDQDILPVYLDAARDGELRARVVGALWWDRQRGLEQLPELLERRGEGRYGRFRPTTVKIMQDGVAENFTAAMLEPYLDACGCRTANAGLSFVDPLALREHVTALDAAGFQVHFHALGDRAVREALDALEAAYRRNGPGEGRHHLAHLQVVHPDDLGRFALLDAVANIQPLWAAHEPQMDELTIPFLGERRASWQYPFGDLERAGARIAAGSDWSVSSADPLAGVHVAVNRRTPGAGPDAEPLYARNALDLATALTAYTAGSAWVNHQEELTGRLREGMDADLVVLDRDPFAHPSELISDARVRQTYVEGARVFARDDAPLDPIS
ncbi:MAG TPA: amidohydrolase [Actinomycetes bacterium]|nr:amidohydrolase [Actinomycetes bacterium]